MDILSFTLFITLKRKYKTYSLFTEYHISSKVAWFEPVQGCRSILYRNTLSNLVFDEQTRFTQQNEMDMKMWTGLDSWVWLHHKYIFHKCLFP